jgi:class 3 adenylate cyclase
LRWFGRTSTRSSSSHSFLRALDVLLRHHLEALRRPFDQPPETPGSYETQILAVGFSDIVDSSRLARDLSTNECGRLLRDFDGLAADTITHGRGRVVKLIGDEVMFVAPDAPTACAIALELAATFREDAALPALRSGVDLGKVLTLDGDYYGPIVNRAARLVGVAPANGVLVSAAVRDRLDPRSPRVVVGAPQQLTLKGFDEPQLVYPVDQPGRGPGAERSTSA